MPRKPRFYLPSVPVHLVQRGNLRAPVYFEAKKKGFDPFNCYWCWVVMLDAMLNIVNLFDSTISPHSSYACKGDFCDNKQPGIGAMP